MAALLHAAARLRPAATRARLAALPALGARQPQQQHHHQQQQPASWAAPPLARGITQSRALLKRKGGASAFVAKPSGPFRGKPQRTKDKLKKGVAPHRTHLESMRELKSLERANVRNEREWDRLEQDAELSRELDAAFDYLNGLGAQGDYVYEPEPTLADLDERDALAKLNALARGDPADRGIWRHDAAKHTAGICPSMMALAKIGDAQKRLMSLGIKPDVTHAATAGVRLFSGNTSV